MSNLLTAEVENGAVAVERIHKIATLESEADAGRIITPPKKGMWPMRSSIVSENYSMRYAENLPLALNGLSFKVQGGLKVDISGRTGSGKSSTIKPSFEPSVLDSRPAIYLSTVLTSMSYHSTLCVLHWVLSRKIHSYGIRQSGKTLTSRRRDPKLPTRTSNVYSIGTNFERYTKDQICGALERVGVKEAVPGLSNRLDTILEDGAAFSHGQV
ncbi:multidrug resistance-associated 5 isoform X1 [Ceratobasidium sp. AG-Ba]|nr:multidrug resistance-associated 5 isoform X1 [Ceratobasidium sp. AG-Ba]